ncbi:MAG: sigma-70 family RNA polymerase sigma factor [Pirellulales bacterium]
MDQPVNSESLEQRTARFMRLHAQNERRIFAFVLSLLGNLDDTNEVIQETCVRLWEQFDTFNPEGDFGAWACSIAYYQVLSMRKRLRTSKLEFGDAYYKAIADEVSALSKEIDSRQIALHECLKKLDPRHRELLRLCYSGDHSVKAIAHRLGRSLTATYSSLFRIRRMLRECIESTLLRGIT